MTRVNYGIKMQQLSDKLLTTELREDTRIFSLVCDRIKKGQAFTDIPDSFRLGSGHVKFFFNKCKYIMDRYIELRDEYKRRYNKEYNEEHFEYALERYYFIEEHATELCCTVEPSKSDIQLVVDRILERSQSYGKHLYYGKPIEDWNKMLEQ